MIKKVTLHALALAAVAGAAIGAAAPASAAQSDVDLRLNSPSLNGSATRYSPTTGVEPGGVVYLNAGYGIQGTLTSPWTAEVDLPEGFTADPNYHDPGCQILPGGRKVSCLFEPNTGQNYGVVHVKVWADAGLCPGTAAAASVRIASPEDSDSTNNEGTVLINVF